MSQKIQAPFGSVGSVFLGIFLLLVGAGCATTSPKFDQKIPLKTLLEKVRAIGAGVSGVKGTAWMKFNFSESQQEGEFSGQYSTSVMAPNSENLKISVDNILGGTEATIQITPRQYVINRGEGKGNRMQGNGYWHSIPLKWAILLYLGKIPSPSLELDGAVLELAQSELGKLDAVVKDPSGKVLETFSYTFRDLNQEPWPEFLTWTKETGKKIKVDFKFDQPDSRTLSPKKWEAQSNESYLKVIWKERTVLEASAI